MGIVSHVMILPPGPIMPPEKTDIMFKSVAMSICPRYRNQVVPVIVLAENP